MMEVVCTNVVERKEFIQNQIDSSTNHQAIR